MSPPSSSQLQHDRRRRDHAADRLPDTGEQVGLRHRCRHPRVGQFELLGRPDLGLQLVRHREPVRVGIDLGGMRLERRVALLEVGRHRDMSGRALERVRPLALRRAARATRRTVTPGRRPERAR